MDGGDVERQRPSLQDRVEPVRTGTLSTRSLVKVRSSRLPTTYLGEQSGEVLYCARCRGGGSRSSDLEVNGCQGP